MSNSIMLPAALNEHTTRFHAALSRFKTLVPSHINAAQMFAAITFEINNLPADCTQGSVKTAIINACVVGLVPGPALGHCHFIPFRKGKGDDSQKNAQLVIGYRGFLELAYANDFLKDCNPELVLQGEDVERWHDIDGPQIRHSLPPQRDEPTRENLIGAYCTFHTRAGGRGYFWRSRPEIDRVDRGSKSNTPWSTDYRGMCLKSAIRPAAKLWRMTRSLANAVMLDEQAERDEAQAPLAKLEGDEEEQVRSDPDADARANLTAILRYQVGAEDEADREAVMRYLTGSSLADATGKQLAEALATLMNWEKQEDRKFSDLLKTAKG